MPLPRSKSEPSLDATMLSSEMDQLGAEESSTASTAADFNKATPASTTPAVSPKLSPKLSPRMSPRLSRNPSISGSSSYQEDWDAFPPLDRLTVLDILDNFALPLQLEKLQHTIAVQTEKVRKQRDALRTRGSHAKDRVVEEWRRRVPPADEQLERYRKKMRDNVERLGRRWNDTKVVTAREKIAFICGVLNVLISGYIIGGFAEWFPLWYTAQLLYLMPIRGYLYKKRGYHYFLADLCYFVNFLTLMTIWVFPQSKRLFISTYCLAYGNNAIAIVMWRNSMVFHSFDKITSLFIHIMPCVTLHCIVHLYPQSFQQERYPAVWAIKNAPVGSPEHYGVLFMMLWSTLPYAVWQLSYHHFITVRRREKIAAGRPTSFTWLRRSYSKAWIGKLVLSLPEPLQEPSFMLIQYSYAVLTMLPCPLWFHSREASAVFLVGVFCWSVYNGATYYIDVFGKRFQNELEAMKREVAKWQNSPDLVSPVLTPKGEGHNGDREILSMLEGEMANANVNGNHQRTTSGGGDVDMIPLLSEQAEGTATSIDHGAQDVARERKAGELPA
ncbi:hypothetical protein F5884DRAFT_199584 [Xylogone sp. PMI_703]|nr:hypothetical protein F5884DRAFT_199584 [Xylogone sp. PMI_703]